MLAGKWCLFAWSRCIQCEDEYVDAETDLWNIAQRKPDAKTLKQNNLVNIWSESKAAHAANLHYAHTSSPSQEQRYVCVGNIEISVQELFTRGLVNCCAIGFTYNGNNFLAHVTAMMDKYDIVDSIQNNFDIVKLQRDPAFKIVMWCGTHKYKEFAQGAVKSALEILALDSKLINTTYLDGVDEYSEVGVNARGTFCKLHVPKSWQSADAIIVRQDTAVVSEKELLTDRLIGSSALGFSFGGLNFLALVDNCTTVDSITSVIERNFDVQKLRADKSLSLVMWNGEINRLKLSERTIIEALKKLRLEQKLSNQSEYITTHSEVGVNQTQGPFSAVPNKEVSRSFFSFRF